MVLKTQTDFGFLGAYNNKRGDIPFERFYIGGDGMANNFALDGREVVALRGYPNQSSQAKMVQPFTTNSPWNCVTPLP